ncbi:hypothetical protein BGX29_011430 [Mortierella sp. GBA35]|nr:hypothetical protein BGX29_011430 [Mortierella sp. GBA35]
MDSLHTRTEAAREIAENCPMLQELTGNGRGMVAILEAPSEGLLRRLVNGSFESFSIWQAYSLTEIRLVSIHHVRSMAL